MKKKEKMTDRIADLERWERRGEGGLSGVRPERSSLVGSVRKLFRRCLGFLEGRDI